MIFLNLEILYSSLRQNSRFKLLTRWNLWKYASWNLWKYASWKLPNYCWCKVTKMWQLHSKKQELGHWFRLLNLVEMWQVNLLQVQNCKHSNFDNQISIISENYFDKGFYFSNHIERSSIFQFVHARVKIWH